MRLVASRRLAAPVALLALSLVRAERLHVVRGALDAADASAARGRRRPLLSLALLGATASPTIAAMEDAAVEGAHADRFAALDVDGNKFLSQQEYSALIGNADAAAQLQHMTTFIEADVDSDDLLSLPEYVFARFLSTEAFDRKLLGQIAGTLPPGFVQGIDDMFLRLRKHFPGEVHLEQVEQAVCQLLGTDQEESLEEEDRRRLRSFFQVADIVPDGVLNLNELDFLHFMVREAFVESALAPILDDPREVEHRVTGLFALFDANGDGYIDRSEAGDSMPEHFADSTLERAFFREHILDSFSSADKDGNALIDRAEAPEFIARISGRGD